LSRCAIGSDGHACRVRVIRRFKEFVSRKEKRLVAALRRKARRRLERSVRRCSRMEIDSNRQLCIEDAKARFASREAELNRRDLRRHRSHALRACAHGARYDQKQCRDAVHAEFNKNKIIAGQNAGKEANKIVKKLTVGAASSVVSSVVLVVAALASVALLL